MATPSAPPPPYYPPPPYNPEAPGPQSMAMGPNNAMGPANATSMAMGAQKSLLQRAISLPTDEEKEEMARNFDDKTVRAGFIRKVYSILMCQLSITIGFICIFTLTDGGTTFVTQNLWLFWTSMGLSLVLLFPMICVKSLRLNVPYNFILLFLFTIFESIMVGMVTALYDVNAVLIALGLTAGVTLLLTIFAVQTKIDFTACRGVLLCLMFFLMVFCFIMIFMGSGGENNRVLQLVYGSFGAFVFSLYLIYDTQMMLGGEHKYSISPEEYVFAALALYLDVINIFLYILRIVSAAKK